MPRIQYVCTIASLINLFIIKFNESLIKCQKWAAAKNFYQKWASLLAPKVQYQALVSVERCCNEITISTNHDGQLCCAVNNYMHILIFSNQMWNKLGDKNYSFIFRCRSAPWTSVWLCCVCFASRRRYMIIIIMPELSRRLPKSTVTAANIPLKKHV